MIVVSSEWTPEERLALIGAILGVVSNTPPLTPIRLMSIPLQDCALVAGAPSDFLELNRKNFSDFIVSS